MKKKIMSLCLVVALLAVAVIGGTLAYFNDTTDTYKNTFTVGKVDIELDEYSSKDVYKEDHPNATDDELAALVEGKENEDGDGFDYTSMKPGFDYLKKPVITVDEDSEDCFVFLQMDVTKYVSLINLMMLNENATNGEDADYASTTAFVQALAADDALFRTVIDKWFDGVQHENWQFMNLDDLAAQMATWTKPGENPTTLSLTFGYIAGDPTGVNCICEAKDEIATFMEGFKIPSTVTAQMMEKGAYANGASDISGMKMDFTAYAVQADGIANINAAYAALKADGIAVA